MTRFKLKVTELPSLAAFKNISRTDFDRYYREPDAANLFFVDLPDFDLGVCVVASPIDFALCALEHESAVTNSLSRWSNARPRDELEYKRLVEMIKSQGLSRSSINPFFLHWISGSYKTASGYKELLESKGQSLGQFRVNSFVTSRDNCRRLIEHFQMANEQYADSAYCSASEGSEFEQHASAWSYNFDEFDPICVFLSPRKPEIGLFTKGREKEEELSRSSLSFAIEALEVGSDFPWSLHYTNVVRPPIDIPFSEGSQAELTMFDGWEAKDFELLSLRCRLIRLLGWPQMFGNLTNRFNPTTGLWQVTPQYGTDAQREQLRRYTEKLDLPYDPISELDAYIAEMVQKFPILLESPF